MNQAYGVEWSTQGLEVSNLSNNSIDEKVLRMPNTTSNFGNVVNHNSGKQMRKTSYSSLNQNKNSSYMLTSSLKAATMDTSDSEARDMI